ncbi:MAG: hypothetical protein AABW51_01680 [Nanoarchaeota archaeon]
MAESLVDYHTYRRKRRGLLTKKGFDLVANTNPNNDQYRRSQEELSELNFVDLSEEVISLYTKISIAFPNEAKIWKLEQLCLMSKTLG